MCDLLQEAFYALIENCGCFDTGLVIVKLEKVLGYWLHYKTFPYC